LDAALPRVLKVCLVTPYPPQEKGAAEYAKMFVDALHRSAFQQRLRMRIISEVTEKCPRSRTMLYPSEENFILERVYSDKSPYKNISFLKVFKGVIEDKPHIVHIYWPGDYGGLLGFLGEPFLILFALLRLLSVRVVVSIHAMPRWFPKFMEKEALRRTGSKILAKAVKAYFFIFMFIFCHLANRILIGVVREGSPITRRFAECYRIQEGKIGEEPHGCLEIKPDRDTKIVQKIRRRLNIFEKKVVLCFGFIRRGKGFEYAIRALAETIKLDRDIVLLIAGKGESERERSYLAGLKGLVKELNLEGHVVFDSRFIPREEVIGYFSMAEVLLLPYSAEPVGFSGPLNLAISLGVPVIATSASEQMPGLEELVKLVPPRDVEALKDALSEVLSSEILRDEFKAKLLSHATRYGWPKIARRVIEAYMCLLAKED